MTWHSTAACKNADQAMFFPTRPCAPNAWTAGRAICDTCPHTGAHGPCVREGYEVRDEEGLRGGMTPSERRRLYRLWRQGRGAA